MDLLHSITSLYLCLSFSVSPSIFSLDLSHLILYLTLSIYLEMKKHGFVALYNLTLSLSIFLSLSIYRYHLPLNLISHSISVTTFSLSISLSITPPPPFTRKIEFFRRASCYVTSIKHKKKKKLEPEKETL